jgi:hypothetical protein
METILLRRRAGEDGTLTIPIPETLRGKELEVLVVLQPVAPDETDLEQTDERGWPLGFFEETYGSLADDPIERLPQGALEVREAVE